MTFPDSFEQKCGFTRIRSLLTEACVSAQGREAAASMAMLADALPIQQALHETAEMKSVLTFDTGFVLDTFAEITPLVARLSVEGNYIETEEVVSLRHFYQVAGACRAFFAREGCPAKYPKLCTLAAVIADFREVVREIDRVIGPDQQVRDNASPALAEVRQAMRHKATEVSRRLNKILQHARAEGIAEPDASLALRNGRLVIPVNAANKRKIRGYVHDESATGKTCYIEPAEVVELNNEIRELEQEERREIVRILIALAGYLRPFGEMSLEASHQLGYFDFLQAKARLAVRIGGNLCLTSPTPEVMWRSAVHPLLLLAHRESGKDVVPLDITLHTGQRILVISGPNAGGKSVCLKTVALLQYMHQCGLLVPALENSVFGTFDTLLLNIGDEQSIEDDLSTYSSHLTAMKQFVRRAGERTLFLIDEFGSGTEPALGGAIAEAVLDKLNQAGAFGVITTHYTNLKLFATDTPGVVNGAMLYDTHQMRPLYKLDMGKPGSSFAFEIANRIGLPEDVLTLAKAKVGDDRVNYDKHLREILRDKNYWEQKRNTIRLQEKKLEEKIRQYDAEMEKVKLRKREIVEKTRKESEELLAGINKQIEAAIRTIRETQAGKEATKQARLTLQANTDKVRQRINAILDEEQPGSAGTKPENQPKEVIIEQGSFVRVAGQEEIGEVIEINPKSAIVAFGQLLVTIDRKRLEPASRKEARKITATAGSVSTQMSKRRNAFVAQIDVRGQRTEEALPKVTRFLDEAAMLGRSEVSILHGTGHGILRQQIREFLKTLPYIRSTRDEAVDRGGSGITIVELDY